MKIDEFIQLLKDRPAPNARQMENLEKIKKISKKFHREAGIDDTVCDVELDEKTIVLESAHQPNFVPHIGLIKKAFLLNFFADKLKLIGRDSICLFGFSDYNMCKKIMYKNKFPAMNIEGYEKIGFNFSDQDIWERRRQNSIKKPLESEWERIERDLGKIYTKSEWVRWLKRIEETTNHNKVGVEELNRNLKDLMILMRESYNRAENFADVNAFIISRIFQELLQLDVTFFRLSDIQHEGVFLDESKKILSNLTEFQSIPTTNIKEDTEILRNYSANVIPFWYLCECGVNVEFSINDESYIYGTCKICGKSIRVDFDKFAEIFQNTSPDAIGRNLVYSEGLGTALYVAGTGGSIKYGIFSDLISNNIKFNIPLTIAWKGKDRYMGATHLAAIYLMMKNLKLKLEDFLDPKTLSNKIESALAESKGTKKELALKNQLKAILSIFKTTYSMLDLFVLFGMNNQILNAWQLDRLNLTKSDDFYILEGDIVYHKPTKFFDLNEEYIDKIYDNLNYIEAKFLKDMEV